MTQLDNEISWKNVLTSPITQNNFNIFMLTLKYK